MTTDTKALTVVEEAGLERLPIVVEFDQTLDAAKIVARSLVDEVERIGEAKSNEDYLRLGTIAIELGSLNKDTEAITKPIVATFNTIHKYFTSRQSDVLGPIKEGHATAKQRAWHWEAAQEAIRLAKERELNAANKKAEEDRILAEAEAAAKEGNHEGSEAILNEEPTLPTISLPETTPKVEGLKFSVRWHAEVFDLMALVRAVAAGDQPINYLMPHMPSLNSQAISLKANMRIPGVKAKSKAV